MDRIIWSKEEQMEEIQETNTEVGAEVEDQTIESPEDGETKSGTLLGDASDDGEKETEVQEYDFKLPEGYELDKGLADTITPLFKEAGLSQETAQKIVDSYVKHLETKTVESQDSAISTWEKQIEEWKVEAQKDLGSSAKTDLATAAKFMDKFGSPRLREILDDTGFGNHPELIKLFVRAGKAISEDTFVESGNSAPSNAGLDFKKLYPTMKE